MYYTLKADKNLIKKMNMASIMEVVRVKGEISRANIAKTLKLNSATVSNNVTDLIDAGYLKELGSGISSGGRKPILLTLNTEKIFFIGAYVGIKSIEVGLMSMTGAILSKEIIEDFSIGTLAKDIKSCIDSLVKRQDISYQSIEGVGVGFHGIVDSDKGISVFAPAFKTTNLDIKSSLELILDLPVMIDNDVRVMAMGEKYFGKAKDYKDFVLLNMDQGIGSGIFINNKVYHGKGFGAGEIGHIKLSHENIPCRCGKSGCFESLCSITGIENRFKSKTGYSMSYDEICKQDSDIYEDLISYSKEAFEIIISFLSPEAIILTGRISSLLPLTSDEMVSIAVGNNITETKIAVSQIEDLKVIGSASLIYHKIFNVQ